MKVVPSRLIIVTILATGVIIMLKEVICILLTVANVLLGASVAEAGLKKSCTRFKRIPTA